MTYLDTIKNQTFSMDLANQIGLKESILVQHINYWCKRNTQQKKNYQDGYYWMYNTLDSFLNYFKFMSKNTLIRCLSKLCKEGIIVKGNYNKRKYDRTNWYRINYDYFKTSEYAQKTTPKCDNRNNNFNNCKKEKDYETEINRLNEEHKSMQEQIKNLQQNQNSKHNKDFKNNNHQDKNTNKQTQPPSSSSYTIKFKDYLQDSPYLNDFCKHIFNENSERIKLGKNNFSVKDLQKKINILTPKDVKEIENIIKNTANINNYEAYVAKIVFNTAQKRKIKNLFTGTKQKVTAEDVKKYIKNVVYENSINRWREKQKIIERDVEGYKDIVKKLNELRTLKSKMMFSEDDNKKAKMAKIQEERADLLKKRDQLLKKFGFTANDLEIQYSCMKCKDSGVLPSGWRCSCVKEHQNAAQKYFEKLRK